MALVTKRSFEEALLEKSDWGEITWEAVLVFFSTYAAPILFLLTFFSIAETLFATPKWYDFSVLVGQVFGLDSAGAGLVTRGMKLAEKGKGKAGAWAIIAGGIIVLVTVVSVACVAIPNAIPSAVTWTKPTEAVLIIVRVVGSVCYGFILKLVKGASGDNRHQSARQVQQREDALAQRITDLHSSLQAMQQNIRLIPLPEKIDYQQIASQIAPLITVQEISAQPQPIDYHEVAQQIAPLLVPPPVPTTQEIIKELKPYLDSLKSVAQSVPPERNTQPSIPVVHPLIVPMEEKKDSLYVPRQYGKSVRAQETSVQSGQLKAHTGTAKNGTPESVRDTVQRTPKTVRTGTVKNEQDSTLKNARKDTNRTPESVRKSVPGQVVQDSVNDRLKRGYEEMKAKNMNLSGRQLGLYTNINKNTACAWYKENVQSNEDSENESVQDAINQ